MLSELTADQITAETDRRGAALANAIDPDRRAAALAEILEPFQPGAMYAYVPKREGIDPATRKFIAEEDQQAAFKLFHLEEFVMKAEPVVRAIAEREKQPPTAEDSLLQRSGRAGVSLTDHLLLQVADELRVARLSAYVQITPAPDQWAAWQTAAADPTEAYNSTLIRLMDAAHLTAFAGPKPENAEDLKAAQLLRKAIIETRESRVSGSTRKALERLADAKRQVTKAKMLHKIEPANPSHPGAAKER
jgi:hypothetical protein